MILRTDISSLCGTFPFPAPAEQPLTVNQFCHLPWMGLPGRLLRCLLRFAVTRLRAFLGGLRRAYRYLPIPALLHTYVVPWIPPAGCIATGRSPPGVPGVWRFALTVAVSGVGIFPVIPDTVEPGAGRTSAVAASSLPIVLPPVYAFCLTHLPYPLCSLLGPLRLVLTAMWRALNVTVCHHTTGWLTDWLIRTSPSHCSRPQHQFERIGPGRVLLLDGPTCGFSVQTLPHSQPRADYLPYLPAEFPTHSHGVGRRGIVPSSARTCEHWTLVD